MTQQRNQTQRRIKLAALVLGVACALPAAAQTTGSGSSGASGTSGSTTTTERREDRGFDMGWLGLLGLAGLLGLRRKDDHAHRNTTTTTGR
jgi:hypothetical protein